MLTDVVVAAAAVAVADDDDVAAAAAADDADGQRVLQPLQLLPPVCSAPRQYNLARERG